MIEFIFGIIIFVIVGLPLLLYLVKTIRGKRAIKKKELYCSWIAGISAISPFDIYFVVLAIVETIIFKKQAKA